MELLKNIFRSIFTREEIKSFIFFEVIFGIFISFISFASYIFITNAVLGAQTKFIDNFISDFIISFRSPLLTKIMFVFSLLGSEVIIFGSIAIVIFLTLRKHRKETFIFGLLLILGSLSTTYLKIIYKIPRPSELLLAFENSYSYPSGHALNSFLFYGAISYFIYHFTKNKFLSITVAIINFIIVFFVGVSRVYLGVHHPSDIVAGFSAGFWLLTTTILVDKTIVFFRFIAENNRKNNSLNNS